MILSMDIIFIISHVTAARDKRKSIISNTPSSSHLLWDQILLDLVFSDLDFKFVVIFGEAIFDAGSDCNCNQSSSSDSHNPRCHETCRFDTFDSAFQIHDHPFERVLRFHYRACNYRELEGNLDQFNQTNKDTSHDSKTYHSYKSECDIFSHIISLLIYLGYVVSSV